MNKKTAKAKKPAAADTRRIPREPVTVPIDKLSIAPWNPRGEITPESVSDLVPSIKSKGLIQRIAIVNDPKGKSSDPRYIVVAGNRRLVACRVIGERQIPCELFKCSEAEARQLTLIENLKRKDAEPIYVAKVIQTLREKDKLTTEEIAAEIGMPESWVVRRAKLIDLAPEWTTAVQDGTINCTTDLLEKASRYTQEIQKEAFEEIVDSYDTSVRLSWRDVSREFDSRVTDLSKAEFDRKKCLVCPNNTACLPTLFDDEPEKYGHCLDPRCFKLKKQEAEDRQIRRLESKGHKVVKVKDFFAVPQDATLQADDDHKFACVYHDYNGNLAVRFATKDPKAPEQEEKSVNNTDKERAKTLKNALKKVKTWEESHLADFLHEATDYRDDLCFAAKFLAIANIYGFVNKWNFQRVDTGLLQLSRHVWRGDEPLQREGYLSALRNDIIDLETSPSITLTCFEAANDCVTPEERKLILLGK